MLCAGQRDARLLDGVLRSKAKLSLPLDFELHKKEGVEVGLWPGPHTEGSDLPVQGSMAMNVVSFLHIPLSLPWEGGAGRESAQHTWETGLGALLDACSRLNQPTLAVF